jgi:hypothetical protein
VGALCEDGSILLCDPFNERKHTPLYSSIKCGTPFQKETYPGKDRFLETNLVSTNKLELYKLNGQGGFCELQCGGGTFLKSTPDVLDQECIPCNSMCATCNKDPAECTSCWKWEHLKVYEIWPLAYGDFLKEELVGMDLEMPFKPIGTNKLLYKDWDVGVLKTGGKCTCPNGDEYDVGVYKGTTTPQLACKNALDVGGVVSDANGIITYGDIRTDIVGDTVYQKVVCNFSTICDLNCRKHWYIVQDDASSLSSKRCVACDENCYECDEAPTKCLNCWPGFY